MTTYGEQIDARVDDVSEVRFRAHPVTGDAEGGRVNARASARALGTRFGRSGRLAAR
jgi:hypothetical protein